MITYQQITRNVLVDIGIIDEDQSPSPVQVQDSTTALNQMLAEWEKGEIQLGFVSQTAPTAAVSIPEWAERAVTYDLGVMLAAKWKVTLTKEYLAGQKSAHARLITATEDDNEADLSHLPLGQANGRVGGLNGRR